ncbi:hypothetical protein IWX50DRAFT_655072 [Phyllosticta citricarpa]
MCQLKARKDAKKLFKKPFFAAQLKYHDIKFKSSRKVDDLRNLLEESIRQDSVIEFQLQMKSDYKPQRRDWANAYRAWDERNKEKCNTPPDRAEYDFEF